jgi:hypothetical protein
MTRETLEAAVLGSRKFQEVLSDLAVMTVRGDLPAVSYEHANQAVDWNFALLCSSALTGSSQHAAQDAVLRVAQACLLGEDLDRRQAAGALLERLGNRPSLELAARRDLLPNDPWTDLPAPLQLDVIRRRLELSIFPEGREPISANPFQRDFWTAATNSQWVSISAPTSAGKSFIVKRWLEDRARATEVFQGVCIVPTRALIEEVSRDLRRDLGGSVAVHTLPWDALVGGSDREVFVLTQERLHLLQQRLPAFAPSLLFVDEAQKFGDGTRGVLLAHVLDEAVRRSPRAQVIFASPLASNPESLLRDAPDGASTESLVSDMVTVNQNLLWANQVPRKPETWTLQQVIDAQLHDVGLFELAARPSPDSKRLPYVAVALGGLEPGNVVYANGAADAEKTAVQIFEVLGEEANLDNPDINALHELASSSVHRQYSLGLVVTRGVGFHYGNMPQLLRSEIERLFREGALRYLVCTSTLLEGVNLPCRNLFARGPRKGNSRPMTLPDFWNLAGRAGRWGMEFQGNIVCVDASNQQIWPNPPIERQRDPLDRTTDRVLSRQDALRAYIRDGSPLQVSSADPELEAVFSLLATRIAQGHDLQDVLGVLGEREQLAGLEADIREALAGVDVPVGIMDRHAGISPVSLHRLLEHFRGVADVDSLRLAPPESNDAANTYVRALGVIDGQLGGGFSSNAGRHFQLAILITQWMRGRPLSVLINDRLQYRRRTRRDVDVAAEIRAVMFDVEQYARFQAPKYLAAYSDVLNHHLVEIGLPHLDETLDLSVMLELGVSRRTDVSVMSLGLSRTSTVALAQYIVRDDLTPEQALEWLQTHDLDRLPLPVLVRREIRNLVTS